MSWREWLADVARGLPWARYAAMIVVAGLCSGGAIAAGVTYSYDGLGRLRGVVYDDGTSVTYNLDAAGNRTSVATASDSTAPSQPTSLAGTVVSATRIDLTWGVSTDNPGGSGMSGYKIFRGGAQIATTPTASYSDTTVSGSNTYTYAVAAYDNANNTSAQSVPVTLATPDVTPPLVPTGLTGSAPSSTTINLSWTPTSDNAGGSGLAGYKVYRGGVQVGSTAAASYSDTTVSGTTSYTYTVSAYDISGNESGQSTSTVVTTPDSLAPSIPTGLAATAASSTLVNLTWGASSDLGGSGLAGYRIYRGGVQIGTSATTTFADGTVAPSTSYSYTVAAYDNAGNASGQSTAAGVTTPAGVPSPPVLSTSITITTPNTFYTVSWTATSGATSYQLSEANLNGTGIPAVIYTGTALSLQRSRGQGMWQYTVQACNAVGCSANSNAQTVNVCPVSGCQ